MTVKELKAVLDGCNDDAEIIIADTVGCLTILEDKQIFHNSVIASKAGWQVEIDLTK